MADQIMACIDGSQLSNAVCDYATWAAREMAAPITLVHMLSKKGLSRADADYSGTLGLGGREALMEELTSLDEKRSRLALEHGKMLLEEYRERAQAHGAKDVHTRQRHGRLADALSEIENDIGLLVLGKQGRASEQDSDREHLGSNLERVVRALHKPVLIAVGTEFVEPRRLMMAFDNSDVARRGIETLAVSKLISQLECHVVMVGEDQHDAKQALAWAEDTLKAAKVSVVTAVREGEVAQTLESYAADNAIDMMAMGAYGHSRIHYLFSGSTTTKMMQTTHLPLLLLR
jgi:nucleotide-binding universal stress UspA family protein